MHRIFQLLRRRLVRVLGAFGIGLQVDMHFAGGANDLLLLIVFKAGAIDLVEAAGVAPVNDDVDVFQLRLAAGAKLYHLRGMNAEQGASAFGFGEGKALRCLLNVDAQLRRQRSARPALLAQFAAHQEDADQHCQKQHSGAGNHQARPADVQGHEARVIEFRGSCKL